MAFLRDTFNRSNAGSWGTASDGSGSWSTIDAGSGYGWSITSNTGYITGNWNGARAAYMALSQHNDIKITFDFTTSAQFVLSGGRAEDMYAGVRRGTSGQRNSTAYGIRLWGDSGNNNLQIIDNNVVKAQVGFTLANNTLYHIEIAINANNHMDVYVWSSGSKPSTPTLSFTNGGSAYTPSASGSNIGLEYQPNQSSTGTVIFDDLKVDATIPHPFTIESLNKTGGSYYGTGQNNVGFSVETAQSLVILMISSADTGGDNHGTPQIDGSAMTKIQSDITGYQRRVTLWYKENVSAGSHTFNIQPSTIGNRYSIGYAVVNGVGTTSPLDTSTSGGTESGTSRTGTLTLAQADEFTILANFNLYNAGSNSTKTFGTGDDANLFHNIGSKSSGSFSMTATYTSSQSNAYIMAAFKPAGAAYTFPAIDAGHVA